MPFILGSNSVSGYTVKNSLRFNSASNDRLTRTPSSAGNRRIYTISYWIKRSKITYNYDMNIGTSYAVGAENSFQIFFDNTDRLIIQAGDGTWTLTSTQVFRDVSAWYHIVVAIDTTQATASNRIKAYLNGSQITSFSTATYMSQSIYTAWNNNIAQYVGDFNGAYSMNGYMAEIYNIDGQQLTPSSFGETDTDTGIWIPKSYGGSYGTNGFYLKFANSASLGTDSSGNGNNFTVNNLTSVDQSTDTPTNNFCTGNPLFKHNNAPTFSNGNLTIVTATGDSTVVSTMGLTTGKWYFEAKIGATATGAIIGILGDIENIQNTGFNSGYYANAFAYYVDGRKINNNTYSTYGNSYTTGDVIGVAFDLTNGKIWFAKNGTWQASGDPAAGTNAAFTTLSSTVTYFPAFGDASSGSTSTFDCNFGSPSYSANGYTDGEGYGNFSYAVPSGFYSLCTKNLAKYG